MNRKNTGRLGVTPIAGPSDEQLDVTNLERRLIEIAVRPSYASGIVNMLEAYKKARGNVSIERLIFALQQYQQTQYFPAGAGGCVGSPDKHYLSGNEKHSSSSFPWARAGGAGYGGRQVS